jgi:hypothetical protein
MWYRLAEINGYEDFEGHCFSRNGVWACKAPEHLAAVKSTLTREEISELEKLIADWQPNPSECRSLHAIEEDTR